MSEHAGSSLIGTICALGGLLFGSVGSGLGIYNCVKAKKRENAERAVRANQKLVTAVCTHTMENGCRKRQLNVINNDTRAVHDLNVSFFRKKDDQQPALKPPPISSLGPGEVFGADRGRDMHYEYAQFAFKDADGTPFCYGDCVRIERS